jgi:heme-degrading monooxygenase HmoA
MISRHWKGIAKKEKAGEYIDHLKNEIFPTLKKIEGFISAQILNRELNEGVEFLIITKWKSRESIYQFAGKDVDVAVVPRLVQNMMVQFDTMVTHYEITLTE